MNRMELETDDGKLGEVVDDVLSKMARGEPVDVAQYAATHPDVADFDLCAVSDDRIC